MSGKSDGFLKSNFLVTTAPALTLWKNERRAVGTLQFKGYPKVLDVSGTQKVPKRRQFAAGQRFCLAAFSIRLTEVRLILWQNARFRGKTCDLPRLLKC